MDSPCICSSLWIQTDAGLHTNLLCYPFLPVKRGADKDGQAERDGRREMKDKGDVRKKDVVDV